MIENFRLKVFRTVAEQRHFRKAAELLYLTQPAVTHQITGVGGERSRCRCSTAAARRWR